MMNMNMIPIIIWLVWSMHDHHHWKDHKDNLGYHHFHYDNHHHVESLSANHNIIGQYVAV